MWPFANKIPFVETISENQENEIEIKHSSGNFKISKKDIIETQLSSDYYSLNSSPNYSTLHSILLMLIYFKDGFGFILGKGSPKSLTLNDIRFIISICLSGGIAGNIILPLEIELKFIVWVLFTLLINLIIDKPIKNIIFPFFFKIFFGNFIKNDLITLKTAGNNFIFRGILNQSNLELFSLSLNSERREKHLEDKRKISYFFFYLNCFITLIISFLIFNQNDDSIFKMTVKNTLLGYYQRGFVTSLMLVFLPVIIFYLGVIIVIIALFTILIYTHIIAIFSSVFVGILITEFLMKKITNGFKLSGWLVFLSVIIFIASDIVYYFSMEEIIYRPIKTWVKSLNPVFYRYYLDSQIYLFITSIFSYFTAYSINFFFSLVKKKIDEPIS